MKKRILYVALIFAAIVLAGCRNDSDPPPYEPAITLSQVRITGVPGGAAILTVVLDDSTPKSRGLAAMDGTVVGEDGESYAVAEIGQGTALTPLYYGADIMHFLFALLGHDFPIGMEPPIAVPDVTSAVVSGRGDVTVNYSGSLATLLAADTGTRVWRNIRFADFTADRVLTLDWNAGE